MKQEIKQRIDQIRRGEVPEGYKKTKFGIIPNEWNEECLGKYLQEYKELSNDIDSYPVYSSSRQGLIPQSQYYDNREAVETNLGYKVVPNGYVTYRHMSDDDIFHFNVNETGGEVLVSSEYPVFTSTTEGDLGYLIPMLNGTERFRHFCRTQKMGGTRTRLYYKNLCTYKTVFPPLPEQKKIAEILSAQDKLIALKEKLIEEKKRQKKYLMQQLLTGKKRLPGFSGEWKSTKIRAILKIRHGQSQHEIEDKNGKYPILGTGGIIGQSNAYLYNKPSVLIGRKGTIDKPQYMETPFWTIDTLFYSEIFENHVPRFVYYMFCNIDWSLYNEASGIPSLTSNTIENITIEIPNYDEQTAIARVLSAVDRELDLLKRDLDQEKQKKKALMQLLLSGVVRVNV